MTSIIFGDAIYCSLYLHKNECHHVFLHSTCVFCSFSYITWCSHELLVQIKKYASTKKVSSADMALVRDLCLCASGHLTVSSVCFAAIVCTLNLQRKEGQGKISRQVLCAFFSFSTCYFALCFFFFFFFFFFLFIYRGNAH